MHDMVLLHGNSIKIHVLIVTGFCIWKYYGNTMIQMTLLCVFCFLCDYFIYSSLLLSHCTMTIVHLLLFLQFSNVIITLLQCDNQFRKKKTNICNNSTAMVHSFFDNSNKVSNMMFAFQWHVLWYHISYLINSCHVTMLMQ